MASRRRYRLSFRGRLFGLTIALVWGIIAVMVVYMYNNERDYRIEMIKSQLGMVDHGVIYAYENNINIPDFVKFLDQYFEQSIYDNLYLSVYNSRGELLASTQDTIPLNFGIPVGDVDEGGQTVRINLDREFDTDDEKTRRALLRDESRNQMFYYSAVQSEDGNLIVMTAMPYSKLLKDFMGVPPGMWYIAIGITILATFLVWLTTRVISRNISFLRRFATQASKGETVSPAEDIPHDELGEISRNILSIYQQRINAIAQSEREHRIALHAVEEKARIKHQLTNNINHELKTPIGVIRGYLDTIADTPDMDEATRNHFIERARQNVERLCALMGDVSTLTRLEDGADTLPLKPVNVHDLLFTLEDDIRESGLAGTLDFHYDIPLDCVVIANESLLTGALLNLIKNAALHSHGTEVGLSLVAESQKFFIFSFYDDGVGVPPEHLSHLFERFYRVDEGRSRKAGGTGLGLPIVKKTIVGFGGAISVHNRSTGGLEYTFSLKKVDDNQKKSGCDTSADSPESSATSSAERVGEEAL